MHAVLLLPECSAATSCLHCPRSPVRQSLVEQAKGTDMARAGIGRPASDLVKNEPHQASILPPGIVTAQTLGRRPGF